MNSFTLTAAEQARASAGQQLDLHWPARRGEEISQADARAAVRAFGGGGSIHENDHAAADALLGDLMAGGLLERRRGTLIDWVWIRPLRDFDWQAFEERTRASAVVTMFQGWDDAEPRPWHEVSAEIEERRRNPPPLPPTIEDRLAQMESRIAQLEAEKAQQTTNTTGADDAPADNDKKAGRRSWRG